jgi:hypothetical protein
MLTQENYCLFTGQSVSYSDTEWSAIVGVASSRLASLLCLEELPEITDETQDLALLLSNFICTVLKFQGASDEVESKSVRNFTINFKSSATNAFEQIYAHYKDIIDKYSNCGLELKVERNARHCCGYYNNGYLNF